MRLRIKLISNDL